MARTLRDTKFDTRAARARLATRREPYWRSISIGLAIGYRKGARGGTWIARHQSAEYGRRLKALGHADDNADADSVHVLSFAQAQEIARNWFTFLAREDNGEIASASYTVQHAIDDYIADYIRRGGRGLSVAQAIIRAHIMPTLGILPVVALKREQIEKWHETMAKTPPRARSKKDAAQQYRKSTDDEDMARRRKSTANRNLTVLKAALNHAYQRGRATNPHPWQSVKPFRRVDSAKIRYLTDEESKRLVNVCADDLRNLVTAALLTGARYGELTALKICEFNPDSGTLHIIRSKSGKPRHIVLSEEGRVFFEQAGINKGKNDLFFLRANGTHWKHANQFREMNDVCGKAHISPAIGFHILRHTYASRLAMKGVPLAVIASQLGHSDSRMTEKHYAHLAPSYVADTVRAAFGTLGILKPTNVVPLSR